MASKVTGIGFLAGENQPTFFVQKILPLLGDDLAKEFLQFLNAHLSNRLHALITNHLFCCALIEVLAAFQTPIGFVVFTDNLDDDASFCPIKQIKDAELTDMQAVFLVPNHPLVFDNIGVLG
jgi:hypothetical protein